MDAMKAAKDAIAKAMASLDKNQHLLFLDREETAAGLMGFKCDEAMIELTYRYDTDDAESEFYTRIKMGECVMKDSGINGWDINGGYFALHFKKIYYC